MKQVPPAIQESQRYLKFKVRGKEKDIGEIVNAVWDSATKYMGTRGCSEASIWIIGNKFDEEKQEGVIKVNRRKEDDLRAALTLNPCFEDETFLSVEKVSGTLAGLEGE
ncbi:MAG: Rpp14/Pop5 family protein [Candidatus Nanohalobium sp.]